MNSGRYSPLRLAAVTILFTASAISLAERLEAAEPGGESDNVVLEK